MRLKIGFKVNYRPWCCRVESAISEHLNCKQWLGAEVLVSEGVQAPHTKLVVYENRTVLSLKSFKGHGGMGEGKLEKRKSCQQLKG